MKKNVILSFFYFLINVPFCQSQGNLENKMDYEYAIAYFKNSKMDQSTNDPIYNSSDYGFNIIYDDGRKEVLGFIEKSKTNFHYEDFYLFVLQMINKMEENGFVLVSNFDFESIGVTQLKSSSFIFRRVKN